MIAGPRGVGRPSRAAWRQKSGPKTVYVLKDNGETKLLQETAMAFVVRFHQIGGPEVLTIEQVDVPPPGPGEVRIAVKALGLNRAEAMFRSGQYLEQPTFPARLGYEAAGTVEALGDGVQGLKVGDAVSTIPAFSLNQYGVYGDTATVPAVAVASHPTSLSWARRRRSGCNTLPRTAR